MPQGAESAFIFNTLAGGDLADSWGMPGMGCLSGRYLVGGQDPAG